MKLTKQGVSKEIENPKVIERLQRDGWKVAGETDSKKSGGKK